MKQPVTIIDPKSSPSRNARVLLPTLLIVLSALQSPMAHAAAPEDDKPSYEQLQRQWLEKVLALPAQPDPRADDDRLRPVMNYDTTVVEVNSTAARRSALLVGGGWQLIGALIDAYKADAVTYWLIGQRALNYRAGLWNNSLDASKSFEAFFVIRRDNAGAHVLASQRLQATTSQLLLGLRLAADGHTLEVVQNTASGVPVRIWSHAL